MKRSVWNLFPLAEGQAKCASRKFSCGLKRLDHATWQGVVIMSGPCNLAGEGWRKTSGPCNLAGEGWLNTSGLSKTYKARETASPTTVIAIHFVKGSPSFFFHSSSCDSSSVSLYSWTKTLQPVVYIFLKEELSSADKEKNVVKVNTYAVKKWIVWKRIINVTFEYI